MISFLSNSNINNTKDPLNYWRQLTLTVRATPNDFANHTQRIMLAMDLQLQPYLAGSFQDFFIALKETGRPLKEKMFRLGSPLLENFSRHYFLQWLEEGTDANLECIHYPGSTLVSHRCKKVITTEKDAEDETALLQNFLNENYDSPIDKAQYCIAYGLVDEAQELLEREIISHMGRQHLTEAELLSLYYYSHNKKALGEMSEKLLKIDRLLSDDWKKIQSFAKEW
ncbi:MAG: hypothetical protein KAH03_01615 [Cocleimonas sp.]|nr:hypothetical protein [Cocleimonas sp.]